MKGSVEFGGLGAGGWTAMRKQGTAPQLITYGPKPIRSAKNSSSRS